MGTRRFPESNLIKALEALTACLCRPGQTLRRLRRGLVGVYQEQTARRSPLPRVKLDQMVAPDTVVRLANFAGREGNVTLYELLVISAIVSQRQPKVLLEIGTFDGNTTLQMAHNSPDDAHIYTLDLPVQGTAKAALDPKDTAYIADRKKLHRKYAGSPVGTKVTQCLGDSATFDFHSILQHGAVELAFIDGSHSHDYVRNDTEKVFEILAPGGVVLWHDYVPAWPGVMSYLEELHNQVPLQRIEGTALVIMETRPSPAVDPHRPGPGQRHRTAVPAAGPVGSVPTAEPVPGPGA
jgi:predicted O-methyltransferase YrrM